MNSYWNEILGWTLEEQEELRFSAFSFLREGKYDTALAFFNALVILNPLHHYDLQTLGAICLQMGDAEQALLWTQKALQVEPHNEISLLNEVKALLMLRRVKEALSLASRLQKSHIPQIAQDAQALLLAYS